MRTWPDANHELIERFIAGACRDHRSAAGVYRRTLRSFQRFVAPRTLEVTLPREAIEAWLHERTKRWSMTVVVHRARLVERFLDFLVAQGSLASHPFADLRVRYRQRATAPIVRALLTQAPAQALEALCPPPLFASFLGPLMRDHIILRHAMGYRFDTEAARFRRFDQFLQDRPDLRDCPLEILLREWAAASRPTVEHAWECQELGRDLAKAWQRVDPNVKRPSIDRRLQRQISQQRRHPYIYSPEQIRQLLATARQFPSPHAPLRPLTLYTMLVLAYCAGLRVGEIVRLDLADVHLAAGEIVIRQTKFFKSRILPLAASVVAALREYIEARAGAGASKDPAAGLFWQEQRRAGRYSYTATEYMLANVLRRAGLKPPKGRVGPRIHDIRHTFVVHRMLAWYREGINPQLRLPYLATYLGHKDINSTLVYITVTQELLQQAGARFHEFAAYHLQAPQGVLS